MNTKIYELSDFSSLNIEGKWEVKIVGGGDFYIGVNAYEDVFERLLIWVTGKTLHLSLKEGVSVKGPIQASVKLPSLSQVAAFGKNRIIVEDPSCKDFSIILNGESQAGLSGIVKSLTTTVSGNSIVNAIPLTCAMAQININGTSTVKTSARDILTVNIAGDGVVEYNNDPKITQNISGKGKVTKTAE